jgi:predicted TIM-barrel fold metal-dependent hydrolase
MLKKLRGIDSAKYLEDSLNFSEKEKKLAKTFSEWLPNEITDCHTHCGLSEYVKEIDDEMYHQMISTFEGFTLEQSHKVGKMYFKGKKLRRLRFPFPFRGIDLKAANKYLVDKVRNPDKVALCGIPSDIDYTVSMLETGKFIALKMYHQQFNPPAKSIYEYFPREILYKAEELGVPIILHLPKMITLCKDELIEAIKCYPNLKISLAHLGLPHLLIPNLKDTYREIAKFPNVNMDTTMIPSKEVLMLALKIFGPKRIMFGSDEPINLVRSVIYQNPELGQRIVTEYMYHWVDAKEHEKYKHLAKGATHMHWPAMQAIRDSIEKLYLEGLQFKVKNDIFSNNAVKFFGFDKK